MKLLIEVLCSCDCACFLHESFKLIASGVIQLILTKLRCTIVGSY